MNGHVQTRVAHHLHGAAEAPAVAELGPRDDGGERSDPEMGLAERAARWLAGAEALELASELDKLVLDRGDHLVPDADASRGDPVRAMDARWKGPREQGCRRRKTLTWGESCRVVAIRT